MATLGLHLRGRCKVNECVLNVNPKIEQWVLDWYQTSPRQMYERDKALYDFAKYQFYRMYGFYVKWD